MRIVGCDLHASQQTIAMLDRDSGESASGSSSTKGRRSVAAASRSVGANTDPREERAAGVALAHGMSRVKLAGRPNRTAQGAV
jgi:hypothetical protein